jgi:carboxyl-terminal processing protease
MFKKILIFMVSKKGLPIVLLFFILGVFGVYKCHGNDNDSLILQQRLLSAIALLIEQRHYSPKPIDDNFSRFVFTRFIDTLDGDKSFFLQSDVDSLKVFQDLIDDEIMSRIPMRFFPTTTSIYLKRLAEVQKLYPELLSKPFDFTTDEKYQEDGDLRNFPKDEAERRDLWRKRLKYETLERFVELQNQREKAKATDSIKNKTDAELQQEARARVRAKWDRYFKRFGKTFKETDQYDLFVNTITQAMDPHTEYFGKVDKRVFDEQMSNHFFGIGAQLGQDDDYVKIVAVIPGSPAWKSGKIHVNDLIIKVGQGSNPPEDITGLVTTDAVKLIRGDKGTEVRLYIKKASNGQPDTVSLIRDEIVQDESAARSAIIHEGGKKIGYIFLPEFYADFQHPDGARCANDVANEIKKLKRENIDGLIMDLRWNPGGSLFDVVQMVGLFIKSGPVVQVRDRDGSAKALPDEDSSVLYTGPLTVMVNEFSASASEIFAAAIQDYKRGIIVGASTYGKGTVQRQQPLGKEDENGDPQYGSLKLTFEKFYRVNGGSTQLRGVEPDIIIPDEFEKFKIREKDNPNALPWDKIDAVSYTPWQPPYNTSQIAARSEERIKQNKKFNAISRNADWLAQNMDKEVDLNIDKYNARQKELRDMSLRDDSTMKSKDSLNVSPAAADHDRFFHNPDEAKGIFYQGWLKNVGRDIYISETVNVMNDMLGIRNNMALENQQKRNPLPAATVHKTNSPKK